MAYLIPKITYGDLSTKTIEFKYPPRDDDGEALDTSEKAIVSISGKRWVNVECITVKRTIKFSFLTETQMAELRDFYKSCAGVGRPFRWYDDKDIESFVWYELAKLEFKPKKIVPVGEKSFLYDLSLEFRRVVDTSLGDAMIASLLNAQAQAVSIYGLSFNAAQSKNATVFYGARRKTDLEDRITAGSLQCVYDNSSSAWTLVDTNEFNDIGVTFSITSGGQVQYTTDAMAGDNYTSELSFRVSSSSSSVSLATESLGGVDGVKTDFDLTSVPAYPSPLVVWVNGVLTEAFSVSGKTITFDQAPELGQTIYVLYRDA